MKRKQYLKSIVIIAFILSFSFAAVADTWYNSYKKGKKAISKGRYAEAEKYFSAAIKERSNPGKKAKTVGLNFIEYLPYYYRGVALYQLGRYKEALEGFEKSLSYGTINSFQRLSADLQRKLTHCRTNLTPKKPEPPPAKEKPVTALPGKTETKETPIKPPERKPDKKLVKKLVKKLIKKEAEKKTPPIEKPAEKEKKPTPLPEPVDTGKKAVERLVKEGRRLFRAGKLEAAQQKFSAVKQLDSKHAGASKWLRTIAYTRAVQSLNSGIRLYFTGKHVRSEAQLREVIGVLTKERANPAGGNPKALLTAYQFLAVILIDKHFLQPDEKSLSEARKYIGLLKGLSPGFRIEEGYFSPKVVKEFSAR